MTMPEDFVVPDLVPVNGPAALEVWAQVAAEFVCDVDGCGRAFSTAHGLGVHRSKGHGILSKNPYLTQKRARRKAEKAGASTSATKPVPVSKQITQTETLAKIVALIYPKGIPTNDPNDLLEALSIIEVLKHKIER